MTPRYVRIFCRTAKSNVSCGRDSAGGDGATRVRAGLTALSPCCYPSDGDALGSAWQHGHASIPGATRHSLKLAARGRPQATRWDPRMGCCPLPARRPRGHAGGGSNRPGDLGLGTWRDTETPGVLARALRVADHLCCQQRGLPGRLPGQLEARLGGDRAADRVRRPSPVGLWSQGACAVGRGAGQVGSELGFRLAARLLRSGAAQRSRSL